MGTRKLSSTINYLLLSVTSSLAILPAYAGTMGSVCPGLECTPYFIEVGTGVSYSQENDIITNPQYWDPSAEGYKASLGQPALFMAGIGYVVSPLLSFDLNVTHRGLYKYEKFQTATTSTTVINPLGSKTRYFNLSSNAFMVNGTLSGQGISERLVWNTGSFGFIQPIIGGGIGVSYNEVSDFHTVLANQNVTSVLTNNTEASFAYQFNAGLEWQYKRFSLDAGYRYFNGGNFESNNYLISRVTAAGTLLPSATITPWKGTLSANEFFVTAKVAV